MNWGNSLVNPKNEKRCGAIYLEGVETSGKPWHSVSHPLYILCTTQKWEFCPVAVSPDLQHIYGLLSVERMLSAICDPYC